MHSYVAASAEALCILNYVFMLVLVLNVFCAQIAHACEARVLKRSHAYGQKLAAEVQPHFELIIIDI